MNRRTVLETAVFGGVGAALVPSQPAAAQKSPIRTSDVAAKDGTKLFVQDWGSGRPVVLLAAWTFNSSVWGSQIAALNAHGFRCGARPARTRPLRTAVDGI